VASFNNINGASAGGKRMSRNGKTISVSGILYPVYDEDFDNITGVMLSAMDETEYLVLTDRYMNDLVNLCQEEVFLRGKLGHQDGMKTITVQEYRIVSQYYDDMADPEDDYDEYAMYRD
jgi:hypothetical protein